MVLFECKYTWHKIKIEAGIVKSEEVRCSYFLEADSNQYLKSIREPVNY